VGRFLRRDFIRQGCFGLAAAGAGGVLLTAGAGPTEASGTLGAYSQYVNEKPTPPGKRPAAWAPTEDNILGPFHRTGAPFRAKITPPYEAGTVLVISGRVWGHDTRKPLPNTIIDIWQANATGRYDNDDAKNPPAANVFKNRARVITDDNGYYEYETIHPGPYQIGERQWRPSHIHYLVRHPMYRQLITQLYFRGDEHQKTDSWIKESLIIDLRDQKTVGNRMYKTGTFDIVLAPARR
jgi:protocatechuate 3,4-dioxygenase beta subunit